MAELILFGVLLVVVGLALWVRLAGTRPQDVADDEEEPTLDVQNHQGDP